MASVDRTLECSVRVTSSRTLECSEYAHGMVHGQQRCDNDDNDYYHYYYLLKTCVMDS